MNIPVSLQMLLRDERVRRVVEQLYKERDKSGEIFVYLPLVSSATNHYFGSEADYQRGNNSLPDYLFDNDDTRLVEKFEELEILQDAGGITMDEKRGFVAMVTTQNPPAIKEIYEWMKKQDFSRFLFYGVFSLNTITGEGYCGDHKTKFHTGRTIYKVYKAFLENQNHALSFKTILSLYYDRPESEIKIDLQDKYRWRKVHETAVDLRKKLGMKGKLSKLLITSGEEYILLPGV